ncbi:hypothetical protein CSKR_102295 [Clonorchis sinensis]|uniref:Uncharacterized protein n=1 Tax=Clonorchis sinensis TaxID=79923 RepID=A0A3R7D7J8_CLOSI|nr:hypothetical protein CSKR_102295 [Clonorchis sinensis]
MRKVRFLKVTPGRPEPTEILKLHQNLNRKAGKHPGQSVIQSTQQQPMSAQVRHRSTTECGQRPGGEIAQVVRGSNPASASRLPLSRLGQPGSIPALVLPSGGMAARYRKGITAEQFFFNSQPLHRITIDAGGCLINAYQTA